MTLRFVNSIGQEIRQYIIAFSVGACVGAGGIMAYGYKSYLPKHDNEIHQKITQRYTQKTTKLYDLIQEHMSADQQVSLLETFLEEKHDTRNSN